MARIKVAIVHTLAAPYRIPLFERLLKDQELDVKLFFTDKPTATRTDWTLTLSDASGRVIRLPEIGIPALSKGGDKIRFNTGLSRVFDWKPDVVLIYGYNEPTNVMVATWCKVTGVPYVLFAETANIKEMSLRRRAFLPIIRFVVRNAAHLAPASDSCGTFFSEAGAESGMTKVPCVPDVGRLYEISDRLSKRRSSTVSKFDFSGRFVVLFAGRFLKVKGLEDLFRAIDIISRHDSRVLLAVVGFGPHEDFMRAECASRPSSCRFFGFVDDETLYELFSVADMHLMPSWYEGYGVVCAEALSFGVPSLVTETSGCKDLIVDGQNGFVVRPKDPEGVADRVLRVSQNPQLHSEMKKNARSSVQDLTMDKIYLRLKQAINVTSSEALKKHSEAREA